MKIYTEEPDVPVSTGNEAMDECFQKFLNAKMESFRWKLMWQLRTVEEDMRIENGSIIIRKDGEIEVNGFSDSLTSKIKSLL